MTDVEWIEVRATVNLPGLNVGGLALVDPELPYMKTCLDAGIIVPTGRTSRARSAPARGAVRPQPKTEVAEEEAAEVAAVAEKPKRRRKTKASSTPPS